MYVINAVMVPHPPLIIHDVGHGEERRIKATTDAYASAAEFIKASKPETIIITSPHAPMYYDYFHISPGNGAKGDFSAFGAKNVRFCVEYDKEFTTELENKAREMDFPAGTLGEKDGRLDHATMIPLYFIEKAYGNEKLPPIVRIGLSGLPLTEHYRLGMLIRDTAKKLSRRISIVASGDLSHRLKPDGPYGFSADGPEYDKKIMSAMENADFGELFSFSEAFCESAGECGHRSFTIMAGCFDGFDVKAKKLSYEGPFGVGYGVCLFEPGKENTLRSFLKNEEERRREEAEKRTAKEDEYVRLARMTVEEYVKNGKKIEPPQWALEEMGSQKAGAFVSLHIDGALRGCIGTIAPTRKNIAEEIIQNGISACSDDPRFPAVREKELAFLEYSVDVLSEAEDISSEDELDIKKYGVIVTKGYRRGLLLPDLEGVNSVEEQIEIAKKKAGIRPDETVRLQRFEVVRHV